jgi:hypothetical protein
MLLEREKLISQLFISLSLIYIIGISVFLFLTLFSENELETQWSLTFAGSDQTFRTGEAVDVQLFLEDAAGLPIEGANMKAVFDRPGTVHNIEKTFSRLDGGLYETEVVFSLPGIWIAMVEVEKAGRNYRNQIFITVQGSIAADVHRDPKDHFHLNQPLPNEIQEQLNRIPVLNR